jgi:5-methylcytosine-specific restriction endonuclease McrA
MQIRRETECAVIFRPVFLMKKGELFIKIRGGEKRVGILSKSDYSLRMESQVRTPTHFAMLNGRHYWMYESDIWSSTSDLQPDDVQVLILNQRQKDARTLDRAKAAVARGGDDSARRKPIPDAVKNEVWQRDSGHCVECGSNENLEFDHVIPVSLGGANTAANLQILCGECNRAKGAGLSSA